MYRLYSGINGQSDEHGFTLVELLVGMLLLGIAMTAIYSSYFSQQKHFVIQTQVAAMQQNLRAAMYMMVSDMRMAGYDKENSGNFGLLGTSNATSIAFTIDDDEDGNLDATPDENISYQLNGTDLLRNGDIIATNIDALNFVYLNSSRSPTFDMSAVRFIEVTLLAQTARGDKDYTDTTIYENQRGFQLLGGPPPGDNLRRRRLTSFIKCRNLGI